MGALVPGALVGPQIDFEKTVTVEPGAIQTFNFDAAPTAGKEPVIRVEIDSREPVSAHVTETVAAEDVRKGIQERKHALMGAAGKRNITHDAFEVRVRPGAPFVVFLHDAQKQTQVTLRVKTRPVGPNDPH